MTILSYLISVVIFAVADVITTAIFLAFTTLFSSQVFKVQDAPYRFSTQLIGTYFGSSSAAVISLYVFGWFNLAPNIFIALLLYGTTWFFINNLAIKPEFQPKAQRTGVILGLSTLLFYKLFLIG